MFVIRISTLVSVKYIVIFMLNILFYFNFFIVYVVIHREHGLSISNGDTFICLVKLLMVDIVHTAQLSFFDSVHILACAHTHALNMSLCLHVVRCYEVSSLI